MTVERVEKDSAVATLKEKLAKAQQKFVIKGGYVGGQALDKQGVEQLSTLAGKDELRAQFLATLTAVPQKFLALLNAAPQNFLYLMNAREEKLKEGEGEKK